VRFTLLLLASLLLAGTVIASSGAAPVTSTIVARIPTGGNPCGVAGAGGAVWVTEVTKGELLKIDPATNQVVGSTKLDTTPCELRYAAGSLWVVTQSGWLDRVDPATAKVIARIRIGAVTYDVAYGFGSVWVTNREGKTVQRINPSTNRVVKTLRFPGAKPAGIAPAAG
jgi:virginiamycin B lyase